MRQVLSLTLAILIALPSLVSSAVAQPGWCARASKPTHFVICRDPALSALDRCEERQYGQVRRMAKRSVLRAVSKNEAQWVSRRNRCGTNYDCIVEQYAERIDELQEITQAKC